MDKAFKIQKQVRDNAKVLNNYLTDLQSWESEMKRKESALNGAVEQDLPPIRSKHRKNCPLAVRKEPEKRILASDYQAWEKFDVDRACEDIDMADKGPTSLDSKKSTEAKMEKLKEEAQYEKERGNNYVKNEKWDAAVKCYNRAIELVKDDAIYYANRGLCYLKLENLHQAESDCTEALRLDPAYVKALQRRATAREKLSSFRSAAADLTEVLRLEPHNKAARSQLNAIKVKIGTKGSKSKSSPSTTPTESKPLVKDPKKSGSSIVEVPENKPVHQLSPDDIWRLGRGENVTVLKPVKKPPHLRSKRPLKPVVIQEILLGNLSPEKLPSRLRIVELEEIPQRDTNKDCSNTKNEDVTENSVQNSGSEQINETPDNAKDTSSPESIKLRTECMVTEKDDRMADLVAPVNSVQFMAKWKNLRGNDAASSDYLSIIDPSKIPSIFENALESDVLSDVIRLLYNHTKKFGNSVRAYLSGMSNVKRFSALAMFLSAADKQLLTNLLQHCKTSENCSDSEIADLRNKYEL